jgi:hypothetical protein
MVWHPAALSRTDVWPNPHPLIEVWAGPAVGSLVPLVIAGVASAFRLRVGYLVWVVAGFCLIANGAYLGVGVVSPVGDAAELIKHGTPNWWLAAFGVATIVPGFCASARGWGSGIRRGRLVPGMRTAVSCWRWWLRSSDSRWVTEVFRSRCFQVVERPAPAAERTASLGTCASRVVPAVRMNSRVA